MFLDPKENVSSFGLREGDIVADFGAGSGTYAFLAAATVAPNGKVYAVDVQRDFLPAIRDGAKERNLKNVEVIWGDIEIPGGSKLREKLADFVIAANVLFQATDKKGLITEMKRVLKDGGKVVVIDWSESFGNLGPAKEHVVTEDEARGLFEQAGFTFVKEIPAGKYHYGMLFRS